MLKLYTHPISQPARTVTWLMTWKMQQGKDFELIHVNPGSNKKNGSRSPTYLSKTDNVGYVPMLELPSGQCIYESNAILTYLAQKYNWSDLYPASIEERATIHQYFNWHHANMRNITLSRFAPLVRLDLKFNEQVIAYQYKSAQAALHNIEARLARSRYICGESLTLADFAAAGEILQTLDEFCGMLDENKYVNIVRWSKLMKSFPKFEESHQTLSKFSQKMFKKNWEKAGRSKL